MTRNGPFAMRLFSGFYTHDRCIRATVVRAFEVAADEGVDAAIDWIRNDDAAVYGGWAAYAEAAFRALTFNHARENAGGVFAMKKETKTTSAVTEEQTETTTLATAAGVITAREALASATAAHEAKQTEHRDLSAEHSLLFRKNAEPDFLDARFPIESPLLQTQIDLGDTEHRVRYCADYELPLALDAHAVAEGDPDALNMATLISDMSELAERSQSGSDQVGILRAVDARGLSYVSAAESLSARRRAVGDPLPLRLAPGQVFRTLQEIARAKTAGVPTTAKAICDAARGHSFVPTDPSMTVEQAAALFLAPQPPKERTGQRERLRRELAELSARAFTVHEERQAEALERARLKKEADGDRKRARERDERAAAEKRKEQDQAAADARARAAKIEAFARMSSGKPRTL